MKLLSLLLLFVTLVASTVIPSDGNDLESDPASLRRCGNDMDCWRGYLCCRNICRRTGDCRHVPSIKAIAEENDAGVESDIEARGQIDCVHANDCGRRNWICCNKKCVKKVNDQHVPIECDTRSEN
ncbi:hypothetical protein BDV25DRAFT_141042 [Aspergillus avenaceus]|uniref:Uncharacterized protein n=1 Tax=Aspergillus avenaceus TaxID=36643 RepID=A0A5N6TSE1_ASPAV|nr:hypothetical protein BDV25DRAFT_141042 [Aspergillus avenaceus]